MPYQAPVTLGNLLEGVVRAVYGPVAGTGAVTRPVKLDDIQGLAAPYTLKTGWKEFGATSDSSSYSRDMESSERTIEQRTGAVLNRVTSSARSVTLPMAEITPEGMAIVEVSPGVDDIAVGAAASGTPAQKRVPFGSISSLPRYRVALIAQRPPEYSSGEGGARGQFVAVVLYAASVAADESEMEMSGEDGSTREVTFEGFGDPTVTAVGADVGCFLFESGATIP